MRTSTSGTHWAAAITVAVAVGMDVLARADVAHVLVISVISVLIGVIRASVAGRCRATFAFLSGATVAQPTLHAVAELTPDTGHATGMAVPHLALAAIVVLAVINSEQLIDQFTDVGVVALLLWFLFTVPHRERRSHRWWPRRRTTVRSSANSTKSLRGPPAGPIIRPPTRALWGPSPAT